MKATEKLKILGTAVQQSPLSIVITDLNANIEYVNPKFCELTGYSINDLQGGNPSILSSGMISKKTYEQLWATILAGKQWRGELLNRKKNGELYWENAVITPILNDNKQITHFLGIKEDITEKKRIKKALQESEEKHRLLFENSPIGIIHYDYKGIISDVNKAIINIFGSSREKLIGLNINELPDKKFAAEVYKSLNGDFGYYEGEYTSYTGKKTSNLKATWIPTMHDGKTFSGVGIVEDITSKKLAEEKLIQINKNLEAKVKERTFELENLNTALKVLLKKRDEDKLDLEEKVINNYESTILPFLEKLKKSSSHKSHNHLINILESNLKEMVSPFAKKLSGPLRKLTPKEIQVASLIKQDKSNKEISDILNISSRTVTNHRNNIRKKLGLINKKVNLRTYLISL